MAVGEGSSRRAYVRLANCRLADMLKEKKEQRRKVLQADAVTNIKCQVAAAVLLHGLPSGDHDRHEGQPKWAKKVGETAVILQ